MTDSFPERTTAMRAFLLIGCSSAQMRIINCRERWRHLKRRTSKGGKKASFVGNALCSTHVHDRGHASLPFVPPPNYRTLLQQLRQLQLLLARTNPVLGRPIQLGSCLMVRSIPPLRPKKRVTLNMFLFPLCSGRGSLLRNTVWKSPSVQSITLLQQ